MTEQISSALNLLRLVRAETDAIGVAVSFGKDSLATLDLCCRLFRRVEGYYLFRVRGLKIVQRWSDAVQQRYGVRVYMYPHFDLGRCYSNAVLQPHWRGLEKVTKIRMTDIERRFRQDARIHWIAYGWRRNDSFSRALIMRKCRGYDPFAHRVFPLRAWKRTQVLDYLAERGIPLPEGLGRKEQGGLDFHPAALEFLRQQAPSDYRRWLHDFPFAELQVKFPQAQSPSRRNGRSETARIAQ